MSFLAQNHMQYRLTIEGAGTRLALIHRAMGLLPTQLLAGMPEGWGHGLRRIKDLAKRRAASNGCRG